MYAVRVLRIWTSFCVNTIPSYRTPLPSSDVCLQDRAERCSALCSFLHAELSKKGIESANSENAFHIDAAPYCLTPVSTVAKNKCFLSVWFHVCNLLCLFVSMHFLPGSGTILSTNNTADKNNVVGIFNQYLLHYLTYNYTK